MKKKANTKKPFQALVWILIISVGAGLVFSTGIFKLPSQGGAKNQARYQAIDSLLAQTKANPGNVSAWIRLGNNYFDTDQYEEAIQAYTRALDLDPTNPNVITDMGVMYRRSGNPEKAVETFDRAIAADPTHQTSRLNKGIVLLNDLGDTQGAVAAWEGLLKINPYFMMGNDRSLQDLVNTYK